MKKRGQAGASKERVIARVKAAGRVRPFVEKWQTAIDAGDFRGAKEHLQRGLDWLSQSMSRKIAADRRAFSDLAMLMARTPAAGGSNTKKRRTFRCSFCEAKGRRGVAGWNVYICEDCIRAAWKAMKDGALTSA